MLIKQAQNFWKKLLYSCEFPQLLQIPKDKIILII